MRSTPDLRSPYRLYERGDVRLCQAGWKTTTI